MNSLSFPHVTTGGNDAKRCREKRSQPRILSLHGKGGNEAVSLFQFQNLGLEKADTYHLTAPIHSDVPGCGVPTDLGAPFFNWFYTAWKDGFGQQGALDELCAAIAHVLKHIDANPRYETIFGFSQGALIAHLVNNLPNDHALIKALQERGVHIPWGKFVEGSAFERGVFTCAAGIENLDEWRANLQLGPEPAFPTHFASFHIIGLNDHFRGASEAFLKTMQNGREKLVYVPCGHEFSFVDFDPSPIRDAISYFLSHEDSDNFAEPSPTRRLETSPKSKRVVNQTVQRTTVSPDFSAMPQTIFEALLRAERSNPLLRLAKDVDPNNTTSYGQLLDFMSPTGAGDLRRIGVQENDRVGYVPRPGGGAQSAAAFLTFAAQTCAVPLSAGLSKADAAEAIKQFELSHIVLFDDVKCAGVQSALDTMPTVKVHWATMIGDQRPGLFTFQHSNENYQDSAVLQRSPNDTALLLRTSGTTSKPKVVPLTQSSLILNASLLSDGLGLDQNDVTYSVMPLDHIGGISATVLASIVVGASICCEDQFVAETMAQSLSKSQPQPTWYSAVPTIHNALIRHLQTSNDAKLDADGRWSGHGLRMVRSGAAALKEKDKVNLEQVFGCPIVSTYSMSEQMPISQPALSDQGWAQVPNSVGVPVSASLTIVDPVTLTPLPYGNVGEICIAGSTVFDGYLDNPEANSGSRFLLKNTNQEGYANWFRTGDLGELDADGNLFLRGRQKELIKRGGEQVSPFELEAVLNASPLVDTSVCFPAPSEIYGEEVACAIILNDEAKRQSESETLKKLRRYLKDQKVASFKIPTIWRIVEKSDLPRTATGKYMRNKCAAALLSQEQNAIETVTTPVNQTVGGYEKTIVSHSSLAGFRFLLACYVMFMHIGSNDSWQAFSNLRQFPWHVHTFFAVAGFSLALVMPPPIHKKIGFIASRILSFYPLYAVAVLFALINMLVVCSPANFTSDFNWVGGETYSGMCHGTPWIQGSWWQNLLSTVTIHLVGLQASPLWQASWWVGFYLWFISMYIQCLVLFPFAYNLLHKLRGDTKKLLLATLGLLSLNAMILIGFWQFFAISAHGYNAFDIQSGMSQDLVSDQVALAAKDNTTILSFYLFAPFWAIYFIAGMAVAFIYDAVQPAQWLRKHIWGTIADSISVLIIALSVAQVLQGYIPATADYVSTETFFMLPDVANSHVDVATVNRIWDNIYPRLFAPITLLWMFCIATGQGATARLFSSRLIAQNLAPTALGCFLFHQMVAQWYFAITRNGEWWNWWDDQKLFYWFSPKPVAVEWYEYFYVVALVVLFTRAIEPIDPKIRQLASSLIAHFKKKQNVGSKSPVSSQALVLTTIEKITGLEPELDDTLEECGLASIGIVQFTSAIERQLQQRGESITFPLTEVLQAEDLSSVAMVLDQCRVASTSSSSTIVPPHGLPAE